MAILSDLRLSRLIRAAEAHSERESEGATPRRRETQLLDRSLASPIVDYLLEPYERGYWELRALWNPSSPFAKYLIKELGTLSEIESEPAPPMFSPTAMLRKLSDEKRQELLRASNRLSSINVLFRSALQAQSGEPNGKMSERDSWIQEIDLTQVPVKFPDAWNVFTNQIMCEGLQTSFFASKPCQTKNGLVTILKAPRISGTIEIVAMGRDEVLALRDFYLALGAISETSVRRVFAPDEDLFRPYFALVSCVLTHVVHDDQISRVFSEALAYYEEEDYQHCISSLGLIAEDYLQRIYTTLLREPLSGGLTLGQTVERLHKRIDELFPHPKLVHRSADPIYEQIKNIDQAACAETLKPILRDLIALILEDRQYHARRLEESLRPPSRRSVLPATVADRLNELLKWRNAASHNSRIPLGAHEADRTLYCLIGVITWWQEKTATMDWTQDRIAIVEELLQQAKAR